MAIQDRLRLQPAGGTEVNETVSFEKNGGTTDLFHRFWARVRSSELGGHPASAKPWKGLVPGVFEIVEDDRSGTYRTVYTVHFRKAVYCTLPEEIAIGQPYGARRCCSGGEAVQGRKRGL